jgi:hypothetical protein
MSDLIPCRFPVCLDREAGCFAECTAYLAAMPAESQAQRRNKAKKQAAKPDDQSAGKTVNSPGVAT